IPCVRLLSVIFKPCEPPYVLQEPCLRFPSKQEEWALALLGQRVSLARRRPRCRTAGDERRGPMTCVGDLIALHLVGKRQTGLPSAAEHDHLLVCPTTGCQHPSVGQGRAVAVPVPLQHRRDHPLPQLRLKPCALERTRPPALRSADDEQI